MNDTVTLPDPTQVPDSQIPGLLAQLAALQTALAARMMVLPMKMVKQKSETTEEEDDLLTAEQAALLLNVSADWFYKRTKTLPFARRLSRRAVRFSKVGLLRWRDGRRG